MIALLVAGSLAVAPAPAAANEALDAAFARLWAAQTDPQTAAAVEAILAAGPDAGEVRARLRAGRPYAPAPTGRQALSRRNRDGVEHPYILHVPAGYDPAAPLPLRVYLHGGAMRPLPTGDDWWRGEDRWVRDDAIVVAPLSWNASPWWRRSQIENLAGLLADLKRRYNVDENRVHLLGVSDGATGAYYFAFKAATPWAGYLAFIGHPAVLGHPGTVVDGQMHVVNLRGKPLFVVNGARDRLYPAALIEPYVRLFADAGVEVAFRPQAEAGHDLSWWDAEAGRVEAFIAGAVRSPLPDALTWETESAREFNRSHWLVIDELGAVRGEPALDEHNQVSVPGPRTPLGIDAVAELPDGAGLRLAQVGSGSLAEQAGGPLILEMGAAAQRILGEDVPGCRGGAPLQPLRAIAHRLPPPSGPSCADGEAGLRRWRRCPSRSGWSSTAPSCTTRWSRPMRRRCCAGPPSTGTAACSTPRCEVPRRAVILEIGRASSGAQAVEQARAVDILEVRGRHASHDVPLAGE